MAKNVPVIIVAGTSFKRYFETPFGCH